MEIQRLKGCRLPPVCRSVHSRIAYLVSILFAVACSVNGQPNREPQAKSPEEFDDFLEVQIRHAPADIVAGAKRFEEKWPESEMLGLVYRMEMSAYRQLGNAALAIEAGERALKKAPDNLDALAELAYLLADSKRDETGLARAGEYAKRVLTLINTIQIPRSVSPEEWDHLRSVLEAKAHTALGLVAFHRGRLNTALEELQIAKRLTPEPDPALLYRLGLLYQVAGDHVKAVEMLQQAAKSGDPALRNLAEQQLKKARTEQPPRHK